MGVTTGVENGGIAGWNVATSTLTGITYTRTDIVITDRYSDYRYISDIYIPLAYITLIDIVLNDIALTYLVLRDIYLTYIKCDKTKYLSGGLTWR